MFEKYFPVGIAEGEAFIGRKQEIKRLKNNIVSGTHSLLLAPRRHGKTSLAKHVIDSLDWPWLEIDLFVVQDEVSIEQKFIKGIQSLLSKIDKPENWLRTLITYFKKAEKTWSIGIKGLQLELKPDNHKDVPENILEILNVLEYALSRKKMRVVIFIDEFQEIANISSNRAIEGAVRHFAQSAKHVAFIFSGSSRHMLQHMFGDKTRPLYALCDEIRLDRLSQQEYRAYLNKIAKATWKIELPEETFAKIVEVTECHPRYVYYFCTRLWEHFSEASTPPTMSDVDAVWSLLIEERLKDNQEILRHLPLSQIKILSLIALGHNSGLTGKQVLRKMNMSGSAIIQAIQNLERDEFIEKLENKFYRIIDPLLKSTIIKYGSDYFL